MLYSGSAGSGKGLTKAFVGGDGVSSGQVEATSSAKKEFDGEPGKAVDVGSARRKPSILTENRKVFFLMQDQVWFT